MDPRLERLAAEGPAEALRELVASGQVNVNARNKWQNAAIHLAVIAQRSDLVQVLIDAGCDAGASGVHGQTPVVLACSKDNVELLRLLLGSGAEESSACCQSGALACLGHLLASKLFGVNDRIGFNQDTAMMLAAMHDQAEAARLLLDRGADASLANDSGETAAQMSRAYNPNSAAVAAMLN